MHRQLAELRQFRAVALTPETKPVTVAVSQQQAVLTARQHEPESQILIACENEQQCGLEKFWATIWYAGIVGSTDISAEISHR